MGDGQTTTPAITAFDLDQAVNATLAFSLHSGTSPSRSTSKNEASTHCCFKDGPAS